MKKPKNIMACSFNKKELEVAQILIDFESLVAVRSSNSSFPGLQCRWAARKRSVVCRRRRRFPASRRNPPSTVTPFLTTSLNSHSLLVPPSSSRDVPIAINQVTKIYFRKKGGLFQCGNHQKKKTEENTNDSNDHKLISPVISSSRSQKKDEPLQPQIGVPNHQQDFIIMDPAVVVSSQKRDQRYHRQYGQLRLPLSPTSATSSDSYTMSAKRTKYSEAKREKKDKQICPPLFPTPALIY